MATVFERWAQTASELKAAKATPEQAEAAREELRKRFVEKMKEAKLDSAARAAALSRFESGTNALSIKHGLKKEADPLTEDERYAAENPVLGGITQAGKELVAPLAQGVQRIAGGAARLLNDIGDNEKGTALDRFANSMDDAQASVDDWAGQGYAEADGVRGFAKSALQNAPQIALSLLPGAALGKAASLAKAAKGAQAGAKVLKYGMPVAAGLSFGQNYAGEYGDARKQTEDKLAKASPDDLRASEAYGSDFKSLERKFFDEGMSADDAAVAARDALVDSISENRADSAAVINTALEFVAPGAMAVMPGFAKTGANLASDLALAGKMASGGRFGSKAANLSDLKDVGLQFLQEGAQGGVTERVAEGARANAFNDEVNYGSVLKSAALEGLAGGIIGGASQMASGGTSRRRAQDAVDEAQALRKQYSSALAGADAELQRLAGIRNQRPLTEDENYELSSATMEAKQARSAISEIDKMMSEAGLRAPATPPAPQPSPEDEQSGTDPVAGQPQPAPTQPEPEPASGLSGVVQRAQAGTAPDLTTVVNEAIASGQTPDFGALAQASNRDRTEVVDLFNSRRTLVELAESGDLNGMRDMASRMTADPQEQQSLIEQAVAVRDKRRAMAAQTQQAAQQSAAPASPIKTPRDIAYEKMLADAEGAIASGASDVDTFLAIRKKYAGNKDLTDTDINGVLDDAKASVATKQQATAKRAAAIESAIPHLKAGDEVSAVTALADAGISGDADIQAALKEASGRIKTEQKAPAVPKQPAAPATPAKSPMEQAVTAAIDSEAAGKGVKLGTIAKKFGVGIADLAMQIAQAKLAQVNTKQPEEEKPKPSQVLALPAPQDAPIPADQPLVSRRGKLMPKAQADAMAEQSDAEKRDMRRAMSEEAGNPTGVPAGMRPRVDAPARKPQKAVLPDVILRTDGEPFPNEAEATRAMNRKGAQETHEVAPAPQGSGVVVKRKKANTIDVEKDDILAAIAKAGGVNWEQARKQGGFDPAESGRRGSGILRVFKKNGGMALDRMAETLSQYGYPVTDENGDYTVNALLDAIDAALRGSQIGTAQFNERLAREMHEQEAEWQPLDDAFDGKSSGSVPAWLDDGADALVESVIDGEAQPSAVMADALNEVENEREIASPTAGDGQKADTQAEAGSGQGGNAPAVGRREAGQQEGQGGAGQDSGVQAGLTGNWIGADRFFETVATEEFGPAPRGDAIDFIMSAPAGVTALETVVRPSGRRVSFLLLSGGNGEYARDLVGLGNTLGHVKASLQESLDDRMARFSGQQKKLKEVQDNEKSVADRNGYRLNDLLGDIIPNTGKMLRKARIVADNGDGTFDVEGTAGNKTARISGMSASSIERAVKRAKGQDDFALLGQTEAERLAEEQRQADAAEAQRKQDEQARLKAQADREISSFTLTGSDRPADVAMAAGQNDLPAPKTRGQKEADQAAAKAPQAEPVVATASSLYADEMFDPAEIENMRVLRLKGREKLISMKIADFLKMAKNGHDAEKEAGVNELVASGQKFSDLPFLRGDNDGDVVRITGHEGRHRARKLLEMGYKYMPVVLKINPGEAQSIRWDQQDDPNRFDYVRQWPTVLEGENGDTMPFPVPREQAGESYRPENVGGGSANADHAQVVEAAKYLKDIVYSLENLTGDDKNLLVELSSDLGKSGRDTILMDAFNVTRDVAHNINNQLDDRKPHKLRAVDMQDALDVFPMLKKVIDDAKEIVRKRDERRAQRNAAAANDIGGDKGFDMTGSKAAKPEPEPRAIDENGRPTDGKPIIPGDTFRTLSGRTTTPYPKQKGEKYASQWLIDNATAEAEARGDDFNAPIFRRTSILKDGTLTTADSESLNMYLFGEQPAVVPSILKPLISDEDRTPAAIVSPRDSLIDEINAAIKDADGIGLTETSKRLQELNRDVYDRIETPENGRKRLAAIISDMKNPLLSGDWVSLGKGRIVFRWEGMDYGRIEDTRITEDRGDGVSNPWRTSDGALHGTLRQAKKHESDTYTKPRLERDGYIQPEGDKQAQGADYGSNNKLVTKDRAAEIRAKLKSKLNGSQLNSGFDPEILALGAELAAFHIEAGVRKFAAFAKAIASDLDYPVSELRPYLRGWFNGARDMIEDSGLPIEGMDSPEQVRDALAVIDKEIADSKNNGVITQESLQDYVIKQIQDNVSAKFPGGESPLAIREVESTDFSIGEILQAHPAVVNRREDPATYKKFAEAAKLVDNGAIRKAIIGTRDIAPFGSRPSRNTQEDQVNARDTGGASPELGEGNEASANKGVVLNEQQRVEPSDGFASQPAGREIEGDATGGARVSGVRPADGGERGNQPVRSGFGQFQPTDDTAGGGQRTGGAESGDTRVQVDRAGSAAVVQAVEAVDPELTRRQKLAAQRQADNTPVVVGDKANIDATLPFLLDGQREDVHTAEKRFAAKNGHGMLFTNGTGTGKTFLSLGVIKRFVRQGKSNILVVVPNDAVMREWQESAPALGLTVNPLTDTKDAGNGIAITTYANFGQNDAIASRDYDLVVMDEAHNLMQNAQAESTAALSTLRAITGHEDGIRRLTDMQNRDLVDGIASLSARVHDNRANLKGVDNWRLKVETDRLEAELQEIRDKYEAAYEINKHKVLKSPRPKALFLSATPFAYEKNIAWAQGYLFDWNEGRPDENSRTRAYNEPSNYERFMIQHFGYRMRYNKLTEPDAKVDRDLMQREFNATLRKSGALSARMLDVPSDYQRVFALTPSALGTKIDDGLTWLREAENGKFRLLYDVVSKRFDYLSRQRLLEAMKAEAAIPMIQKWHELGKKVVVFYDFNEGGGFQPFNLGNYQPDSDKGESAQEFSQLAREFYAKRPDLLRINTSSLPSPLESLTSAFPNAGVYNGVQPKKKRAAAMAAFNDDNNKDANLLIVQSAANAGWSAHDKTGKFKRVLINLGLPTAPTKAIQQEGRIYRQGQHPESDSMFVYMNTGTSWERAAFAGTIARRASTAENLAMGEQARGLRDAFIMAFEDSEIIEPSLDEGKGSKEKDRALTKALSPFDRAKSYYFGQLKKTSATKAREGKDYFATPEPVGMKMVEWLNLEGGEKALEPSAGHGAISRWLPDNTENTIVEPSFELISRAALNTNAKQINGNFEDLNIVNKYHGIVMNPPFGVGGKTAIEHLDKAFRHLSDGGRIVALIPEGPAADKRFDEWMYGRDDKDKPLREDAVIRAVIRLPASTFDRAGTNVRTRIVVIDRVRDETQRKDMPSEASVDLSGAGDINSLFSRIENIDIPARIKKEAAASSEPAADAGTGSALLAPKETTHAIKKIPLFVAAMSRRVDGDTFTAINRIAKRHGGYYSAFSKNKAIPGFQFESEQARKAFMDEVGDGSQYGAAGPTGGVAEGLVSGDYSVNTGGINERNAGSLQSRKRAYGSHSAESHDDLFATAAVSPTNPEARRNRTDFSKHFTTVSENIEHGQVKVPERIAGHADAAAIFSRWKDYSQERFIVAGLDENGRVVEVAVHSVGLKDSASVDPGTVAGMVSRNPDIKSVWISHNHPSGSTEKSAADSSITAAVDNLISATGIKIDGHVILGSSAYSVIDATGEYIGGDGKTAAFAYKTVVGSQVSAPLVDRVITRRGLGTVTISGPGVAKSYVSGMNEPGIVLMDTQLNVLGFWAMTPEQMNQMRQNQESTRSLLAAIDASNASRAIISVADSIVGNGMEWKNISAMLASSGIEVVDAISYKSGESAAEKGMQIPQKGRPFYSTSPSAPSPGLTIDRAREILSADPVLSKAMPFIDIRNSKEGVPEGAEPMYLPAWHGSPYKFDKFSLEHMGKGEGVQAYGWGLYFAGSKGVADHYRKTLSVRVKDAESVAADYAGMNDDDAIKAIRREAYNHYMSGWDAGERLYEQTAQWIESGRPTGEQGQLYKVDIPDDANYLLWDSPVSDQPLMAGLISGRSGQIKEAFDALASKEDAFRSVFNFGDAGSSKDKITGEELYLELSRSLGSPEKASKLLASSGVSGIKYLDGASRSKGDGNYNYVVFDDAAVRIMETFYSAGDAGAEGYYHNGRITLFADNIRATGSMSAEERLKWVAFHEVTHRGVANLAESQAYLSELERAGKNPYVKNLAKKIYEARQSLDAKYHVSMEVATEEALAEINAALRTGNVKQIKEQYGLHFPLSIRPRAKSAASRFFEVVKRIINRMFGRGLTDAQVEDLLRRTNDAGMTPDGGPGRGKDYDAAVFSLADKGDGSPTEAALAEARRQLDEQLAIADRMIAERGGLFAPNGELSKLNRYQWAQVRTANFKAWFGDWVKSPAKASKVVDANGEPLVVYHGTRAMGFNEFKLKSAEAYGLGVYFASDRTMPEEEFGVDGRVIEAFLNIRNPSDGSMPKIKKNSEALKKLRQSRPRFRGDEYDAFEEYGDFRGEAIREVGHDGIIAENDEYGIELVAFSTNQIKSATGNAGTFSPATDDIRYSPSPKDWITEQGRITKRVLSKEVAQRDLTLWQKTLGTQLNAALKNPAFKKVYDLTQRLIQHINNDAYDSLNAAPDVLSRLEDWNDYKRDLTNTAKEAGAALTMRQSKRRKDMTAAAEVLFEGTRFDKKVYSDKELDAFKLTADQKEIYRQARAAIDKSVGNAGKSQALNVAMNAEAINWATVERLVNLDLDPEVLFSEVSDLIDTRIAATKMEAENSTNEAEIKKLDKQVEKMVAALAAIGEIQAIVEKSATEGYAPLMRWGRYTVAVIDPVDGKTLRFHMLESKREQAALELQLREKYGAANVVGDVLDEGKFEQFKGITPETVALFASVTGMDQDAAYQEYLKLAIPGRSALKRKIHRKGDMGEGIEGFSTDLPRVLSSFVLSNARKSARDLYRGPINDAIKDIKVGGGVAAKARELAEFVMEPDENDWSVGIRNLLFVWNMGASVAFGVLNLSQPWMMTLPWLSQFSDPASAAGVMAKAAKLAASAQASGKAPKGYEAEYDRAVREGIVDPQNVFMLQGVERGKSGVGTNIWRNVAHGMGLIASATESMNRKLTLIAALDVARAKGDAWLKSKGFADAYDFAARSVAETQGVYNKGNRPAWARNPALAVMLVFKQYSINWVEMASRMASNHYGDDRYRKGFWMLVGALFMMAGGMGLPFAEDLIDLIEAGMSWAGKPVNVERQMQMALGKNLYEPLMNGPANSLLFNPMGADMFGRMSMGNMIPATAIANPGLTPAARSDEAIQALGAGAGLASKFMDAYDQAASGNVGQALIAASPRAVTSIAKAAEMTATGQYKDSKGRTVRSVTPAEALIKGLDLQPASVARIQRERGRRFKDEAIQAQARTEIRNELIDAYEAGDQGAIDAANTRLRTWNAENPLYPVHINRRTLRKSVRERGKNWSARDEAAKGMEWMNDWIPESSK